MPRPTVALTDLEYRVLRYLQRSRELERVFVPVRTLAEVSGEAVMRMSSVCRRLASFGLVIPDYSMLGTRYAITGLGQHKLEGHHQTAMELAS